MPAHPRQSRSRARKTSGKRVIRFRKLNPLQGDFFGRAFEHNMTPQEYLEFVNKVNRGGRGNNYGPDHAPKPNDEYDKTDWKKWRRGE